MVIFLVSLMPLFYWQIQYLYSNENVRFIDRILPFFSGILLAVPVILTQWALDVYFRLNWNPAGIYFYTFFNKDGIIIYPLITVLYFVYKRKSYSGTPLRELTGWFTGFYFLVSLTEALVLTPAVNPYTALINPVIRLISLMLLSVILVRALHSHKSNLKIYFLLVYFALPLVLNFLPILYLMHKTLFFYILFLLTGCLSLTAYLMENRGKFD